MAKTQPPKKPAPISTPLKKWRVYAGDKQTDIEAADIDISDGVAVFFTKSVVVAAWNAATWDYLTLLIDPPA